jgi:hypothetical protein
MVLKLAIHKKTMMMSMVLVVMVSKRATYKKPGQ